ncbi:TraB family protein [Nanoarchaeota archaeon]
MKNILILGTSHIAQQSIDQIQKTIEQEKPDIIAIELDAKRFQALLSNQKNKISLRDIRRIGLKGYLFALIGSYLQKKLGQSVGVAPGSEMLKAIKLARKNRIPLALIDQDIEITLKRFSQKLTWKERFRFVSDLVKGFLFRKKTLKKFEGLDLTKVPSEELIIKLIGEVKNRYPNVYQVLVHERNLVMIKNLKFLLKQNPEKKILVIVGAGHQKSLEKAFKNKKI